MDKLQEICAAKLEHVKHQKSKIKLADLEAIASQQSAPRGFLKALVAKQAESKFGLIAEIKKASPSKGLIRADFEPAKLAADYEAGGAACLSVLTDIPYFQGADEFLGIARSKVNLPVLRKDFMLDTYQIAESRSLGADCILLIMACLSDAQAAELEEAAIEHGMDVLIEVHDIRELERALKLKSGLIGINNRNLKTFEISLETSKELAKQIPTSKHKVCESGIFANSDLLTMQKSGFNSFLVGESLMRQSDVKNATNALLGIN
jgi:indole-3-glycerol phosphate synthase